MTFTFWLNVVAVVVNIAVLGFSDTHYPFLCGAVVVLNTCTAICVYEFNDRVKRSGGQPWEMI